MKITYVKKIDTTTRAEYTITVPVSEIHAKLDQLLKSASNSVQVPGFRKGKAPKRALINTIGETRIIEDLKSPIRNDAFEQLIKTINVKPVGPPAFTDGDLQLDADYTFDVDFAKEISQLNPSHDSHMPIMGDLSGGPIEVYEKMRGDSSINKQAQEYLPDDVRKAMPDSALAMASSKISDARNPLTASDSLKPKAGETDTAERLSKTTQPDELIPDQPHEELDEKAKPPGVELDEKLPKTDHKPETDIKEPEIDDRTEADELAQKIENPAPESESQSPEPGENIETGT